MSIESKQLPPNFYESVHDLEIKLESGNFNLDTVNTLMLLYSQAVEFFNGINDDKFRVYEERI